MTVIYLFAVLFGLGAWLPAPTTERRFWYGFLFLQSWLLLIVILYVGDVVFGIALSTLWIALIALAIGGALFRIWKTPPTRVNAYALAGHPVCILTLLTCCVIYANGGIEYLPFPGDETSSWLRLTRQMFLIDHYWSDKIVYHLGAYTNGWPLLIAFANAIHETYDDSYGVAVGFLMQLGLIAATFDTARHILREDGPALREPASYTIGWIFILGILAAEASWVLVPTFQLIDEPLIFAFLGCFLTVLLGLYDSCNRHLIAIYLGFALAATYLLKVTAAAFLPMALVAILVFAYRDLITRHARSVVGWNRATLLSVLGFGVAILAPVALANLSWAYFKTSTTCTASPILLLTQATGPAAQEPWTIAIGFVRATLDFFGRYKLPLSLFAGAFLLLGLANARARWLTIGFVGFFVLYAVALYFSYLTCFDVIVLGGFEALPRYMRTPARIAHYLGFIICFMMFVRLGSQRERWPHWISGRPTHSIIAIVFIALFGWQIRSVDRSIDDMRTRDYQNPDVKEMILGLKSQASVLTAEIERRGLVEPRVSLIAQNGYGAEYDLASYFGIKARPDGGSNFIYVPRLPYFWAPQRVNIFTDMSSPAKMESDWRTFDIIWPYRTDDWTRAVLARLTDNAACQAAPERYFLIKDPAGTFSCIANSP
jgi:hypothetical protein